MAEPFPGFFYPGETGPTSSAGSESSLNPTVGMGFNWPNAVVTYVNHWDQQSTTYANRARPFQVAAANGVKVMRTFFGTYDSFVATKSAVPGVATAAWNDLEELLDTAAANGIKLILSNYLTEIAIEALAGTAYANWPAARAALTTSGSAAWNGLEDWFDEATSRFASHLGVFSWEVVNEPGYMLGIDDGSVTRTNGCNFLDYFQSYLKSHGAQKVNGGGRPLYDKSLLTDAQVIAATQDLDYLDDHFYPNDTAANHLAAMDTWVARVNTLLSRDMPVIIGEFGADPETFFQDLTTGIVSRRWLPLAWGYDAFDANIFNESTKPYVLTRTKSVNTAPVILPPPAPTPSATGSGLVRNLAPNPACGVDATGWSSSTLTTPPSDAGYVRSTSVDAGLPRTTGFEGSAAADVNTPRAPVTAGQQYVWSVSVKAIAALSSNMLVNFYSSLTTGGFISNSGATVPLTLAAGQVGRFVLGPYTVPAGAIAGLLKLNNLDGACEITAYRVAPSSGNLTEDGTYFDGASLGWSWDGVANNSSSTARRIVESLTLSDSFSILEIPAGPVGTERIAFAESWSIAASGTLSDNFLFRDGFLIAELEFDETRGRIRVQAFTFGPLVTQVRVQRRAVASGRYVDVRGGTVPVLGGYMSRPVDDYEYPSGVDIAYAIQGLNDQGAVVQAATVYRSGGDDRAWLKFIANPVLNQPITLLTDFDGVEREARTGLFEVQGRRDPIAVTDVHSSRRMTIRVKTETPAETAALDQALSLGIPCFVQVPAGIPVPTVYASIGSYRWQPPTKRSKRSIFEIPLVEIAAPHPSIVGAVATWQSVLEAHTSWEDLYFRNATWRHVASGDHEALGETGGGTGQTSSLETSPAPPPVSPPPSTPQRVGWPAYVYPTIGTHWARYFANARPDDILIANPASGPGSTVDSTYTAVIGQARSLGIKVFGYVDTSYKAVSLATVEGHVDGWMSLYGNVDGIFVDQVTSTGSDVATYYQPLYDYIKTATGNRLVVLNPGTDCDEQFMNCSDIIMNFENTAAQYPVRVVRAWEANYSIYRFWHSIHTITSTSQRDTILALTRGYRAGYVYLTDDDMSVLPYDSLPADPWWPDLIAQL